MTDWGPQGGTAVAPSPASQVARVTVQADCDCVAESIEMREAQRWPPLLDWLLDLQPG